MSGQLLWFRALDTAGPEEFELELKSLGIDRHADRLRTLGDAAEGSATGGLAELHRLVLLPFTEVVKKSLVGKRGADPEGVKAIREVVHAHLSTRTSVAELPGILAHTTLKLLLGPIRGTVDTHDATQAIGRGVHLELRLATLALHDPRAYEALREHPVTRWTADFLVDELERLGTHEGIPLPTWGVKTVGDVGLFLLTRAIEHCRLPESNERIFDKVVPEADLKGFDQKTNKAEFKQASQVALTLAAQEIVEEADEDFISRGCDAPPLPYEPKPWTGMFDGGFHTLPVPFVNRRLPRQALASTEEGLASLARPMAAASYLGSVPWRVNGRVLQALKHVLKNDGLRANDRSVPTGDSHSAITRRFNARSTAEAAVVFRNVDKFYVPHRIDFRGRFNPLASRLHLQSTAVERSLIRFAEPAPLETQAGYEWFMRAGAAALGHDKLPIEEQVAVVDSAFLDEDIRAINKSPEQHKHLWENADDPWAFLAWAFERARYLKESRNRPEPHLGFKTGLAVSLDGSSNALQHLALLARCREDAERVNLLAGGDRPRDVYGDVAKLVEAKLQALVETGGLRDQQFSRAWLATDLVGRKLAKVPTMTLSYGSTSHGRQESLRKFLREYPGAVESLERAEVGLWQAASFIERQLSAAIEEIVVSASTVMRFLQDCASAVASAGHDVTWRSPSGLIVHQFERQSVKHPVRTRVHGTTDWSGEIELTMLEDTSEVATRGARSSISPNFVHALDAAHLVRVIERAEAARIPLGTVHDAVKVRPCDAEPIQRILMEELAVLHREDLLVDFRDQLVREHPEIASELPSAESAPRGDLDPSEIVESVWAFA